MTDLKHLLDLAATAPRPGRDPKADLTRARAAARVRAARRIRLSAAGLALVVAAGIGGVRLVADGTSDATGPSAAARQPVAVRLVSARFDATPYTFDLTPRGWHVQGQNAFGVTIAPDDGSASRNPDDFVGKLVILFDQNPVSGARMVAGGRTFWLTEDSGYTTLATRTRAGEPTGVVRVQYPDETGWTRATMLAFLGSVHVGPGAQPGLG